MSDLIDLIIGAFVAFLPLFYLLMRRRRGRRAMPGSPLPRGEEPRSPEPPGEVSRSTEPQRETAGRPAPRQGAAITAAAAASDSAARTAAGSETGTETAAGAGAPAGAAAREEILGAPPVRRPRGQSSETWRRINALPEGQRAIVLAEIISKPLALREGASWS